MIECVLESFLSSFDKCCCFLSHLTKKIPERFCFNLQRNKNLVLCEFCLPSLPRRCQHSSCFQLDGYLIRLKVMSVHSLCGSLYVLVPLTHSSFTSLGILTLLFTGSFIIDTENFSHITDMNIIKILE